MMEQIDPGIVQFLDRLHDDAEFRYRFAIDPDDAVREVPLGDSERELIISRSVDDWLKLLAEPRVPKNTSSSASVKISGARREWSLERDARV